METSALMRAGRAYMQHRNWRGEKKAKQALEAFARSLRPPERKATQGTQSTTRLMREQGTVLAAIAHHGVLAHEADKIKLARYLTQCVYIDGRQTLNVIENSYMQEPRHLPFELVYCEIGNDLVAGACILSEHPGEIRASVLYKSRDGRVAVVGSGTLVGPQRVVRAPTEWLDITKRGFERGLRICRLLTTTNNVALKDSDGLQPRTLKYLQGRGIKVKPEPRFKTLEVKVPGQKRWIDLEELNREIAEARMLGLHIVRGHEKTYTDEAPLFGKITGTFFWPPHARGDIRHGVIVKDYKVVPSDNESTDQRINE